MNLTAWESRILRAIHRHIAELASVEPARGGDRQTVNVAWRLHRQAKDAGIVPVDVCRWLGRSPSPSDRTLSSRAIRRLMERGFVIGHGDFSVKAVELTEAGKEAAKELASEVENKHE